MVKKKKVKVKKKMTRPPTQKKGRGKKVNKKKKKVVKKTRKGIKKVGKVKGKKVVKKIVRKSVKKKPAARVFTGIPGFDNLIGGGFEKNSTNLLAGGSGVGKTILATQFLVGAMNKGEKCLYVTFEESREQFYENMKKFGWDLEVYERKGLFTFLEYAPIKVKTMLEEGGGTIESIILKKKISRIVIDSITSFELLFKDELAKREAALSLFSMIRGWDCTSFLTLEEQVESGELDSNTLEFEADSIILLYFVRKKGERQRRLEIGKMRGTDHSPKIYSFEIGKKGVVISKSAVHGSEKKE